MKIFWGLLFSLLSVRLASAQVAQTQNRRAAIIPEPVLLVEHRGHFTLDRHSRIFFEPSSAENARFLSQLFLSAFGLRLTTEKVTGKASLKTEKNVIALMINARADTAIRKEGYSLMVSKEKISVKANTAQGLFYGIQTLMQLLPTPNREWKSPATSWPVPCTRIIDYPRFGYRGMMLDISRHFFPKTFVKKYIDEMAKYKFNFFHWHLSDDNGWRIEIKGLPELTKIGAWRVSRTGVWRLFQEPQSGEATTYGGYYSQKDIREIVDYAGKRFVTIIPEIDVPGHSLSLIASYPALSCTQQRYAVNPGSAFYKKDDNTLCVNNDSTWLLLDKIFTQVAQLFPGPYIHIGGDEAYKGFWEHCPKDAALMKKEGLRNADELQSYFVRKLEKMILAKGKKMIGWDEILEGGLAPEATVMSWRGTQGGITAANMGHEVIMAPVNSTYLSRKQSDALTEPYAPGMVRLSTCYEFEPVPDSADPAHILGGEACLWTEFVPNPRHAEYMTWPRGMAISEVLWSPRTKRLWPDFARRVEQHLPRLAADDVRCARAIYDPIAVAVKTKGDTLKIALTTEFPGLDIYYTFDGTFPDRFYPLYKGVPLDIPKGASRIRAISYRRDEPLGKLVDYPLDALTKAAESGK